MLDHSEDEQRHANDEADDGTGNFHVLRWYQIKLCRIHRGSPLCEHRPSAPFRGSGGHTVTSVLALREVYALSAILPPLVAPSLIALLLFDPEASRDAHLAVVFRAERSPDVSPVYEPFCFFRKTHAASVALASAGVAFARA